MAFRIENGSDKGFTYVGIIILLVTLSISLALAGRYWSTIIKREKEEELLFRGDQFVRAIEAYYWQDNRQTFPTELKDLIKDPRSPAPRRYLRRIYTDPMTGKPEGELDNRCPEPKRRDPLEAGWLPHLLCRLRGKDQLPAVEIRLRPG